MELALPAILFFVLLGLLLADDFRKSAKRHARKTALLEALLSIGFVSPDVSPNVRPEIIEEMVKIACENAPDPKKTGFTPSFGKVFTNIAHGEYLEHIVVVFSVGRTVTQGAPWRTGTISHDMAAILRKPTPAKPNFTLTPSEQFCSQYTKTPHWHLFRAKDGVFDPLALPSEIERMVHFAALGDWRLKYMLPGGEFPN
jgi:hypothetical protein